MRRRSFTMIEAAMAIVILGIGMAPLLGGFVTAANASREAVQASIAQMLAGERMEQIVAARYRNPTGYTLVNEGNFQDEANVTDFATFARTVDVQTVNNSLANSGSDVGIKKVTVTVTWNGATRQIRLARLFGDF